MRKEKRGSSETRITPPGMNIGHFLTLPEFSTLWKILTLEDSLGQLHCGEAVTMCCGTGSSVKAMQYSTAAVVCLPRIPSFGAFAVC